MSFGPFGENVSSPKLQALRILVVDDCLDNQFVIDLFLRREGAAVTLAGDGEDAYSLALKNNFDVVLLDIQMPVMDGYETMQKLKAAQYSSPVVAVTASNADADHDRMLAAGFAARITKPIDTRALTQTIRDVIASKFSHKERRA